MAFVADLHVHSPYAGACSSQISIPNLAKWAKFKGVNLLGTGDCIHPTWFKEITRYLKEDDDGFYSYDGVKFVVSTEISCIYSDGGEKARRIHILVYFPSLSSARNVALALQKKGAKLGADGRPILGLSTRQLCELIFTIEPNAIVIPAHIWTPWFSLYGSNSGFDHLSDCFGEFSEKIYAVETGLSSEPAMNWRIPELDNKAIVSFSDLHSLPRLGREVTVFKGRCTYEDLVKSLKDQNILGTIEFFPEEGKYHYSGHRNCGIVYDEKELKVKGEICPVCNRRLTIGVLQRVEELAQRSNDELRIKNDGGVISSETFPNRPGFRMLIQLEEILAEVYGVAVKTQTVQREYEKMVTTIDTELMILTKTPIELLDMVMGEKIAEGIDRVRKGQLTIEPGFDNTYGKVKIWE